jgi:hypothetical protein
MLKALVDNTIVLGLSDENLARLKGDEPIYFNLRELGLPDRNVYIFNGKDEQAMLNMKRNITAHVKLLASNPEKN